MIGRISYFVYVMANPTNSVLYCGVTNNLLRRVYEHKQKLVPGFSEKYNVNKLVYFEEYPDSKTAIEREKQLKSGSRKKKIQLIEENNPLYKDLYDELL